MNEFKSPITCNLNSTKWDRHWKSLNRNILNYNNKIHIQQSDNKGREYITNTCMSTHAYHWCVHSAQLICITVIPDCINLICILLALIAFAVPSPHPPLRVTRLSLHPGAIITSPRCITSLICLYVTELRADYNDWMTFNIIAVTTVNESFSR